MIKLKQKSDGLYTLKNLTLAHIQVIATLINSTRLGAGYYEEAAFDIANLAESNGIITSDCNIAFAVEVNDSTVYVEDITIELSHVTD